ncbi:MAG: hypothetical protein ACE5GJ_13540 [Gemmatimonadota bacterium]
MSAGDEGTGDRCPYCDEITTVPRLGAHDLPGGLSHHEFETLVRAEWRRRLGPESYGRLHPSRLIGLLADRMPQRAGDGSAPGRTDSNDDLVSELEFVIADLRREGLGRRDIQRELTELGRAMRAVLRRQGVRKRTAAEFTAPLITELDRLLGWPTTGAGRNAVESATTEEGAATGRA